jgi:hypothetical protein
MVINYLGSIRQKVSLIFTLVINTSIENFYKLQHLEGIALKIDDANKLNNVFPIK